METTQQAHTFCPFALILEGRRVINGVAPAPAPEVSIAPVSADSAARIAARVAAKYDPNARPSAALIADTISRAR